MENPLISVVVATQNMADTITECINSFLVQTYPYKELIVIDGASVDGTADILRKHSDKLAYWESAPDSGIYHAWNKGIRQAKGEWICFLGADDFFRDARVLEKMSSALSPAINEGIHIVYGSVAILDAEGRVISVKGEPWPKAAEDIFRYLSIPHPGVLHHKSIFNRHGEFDESFLVAGDYELLLRELKQGKAMFVPDVILVGMRPGGISTQKKYLLRILLEEARARYINKINPINVYWLRCILMTLVSGGADRFLGLVWSNRLRQLKGRLQLLR